MKKKRKTTLGGQNKLSNTTIERLQFYFRRSIRHSANTSESQVRDDIMFYHCSSTDNNQNHDLCPKTKESWCFYQKALANNETPASHSKMQVHFVLEPSELELVKKVYERLTTRNDAEMFMRHDSKSK